MRTKQLIQLLIVSLVCAISAQGQWFETKRVGDTAYFFFDFPARVERYDLSGRQWLSPLTLPTAYGLPTAAHADPDGIYMAYDKAVYRYSLTGQGEVHLLNSQESVEGFLSDGTLLFVNRSSGLYARLTSISKTTNTLIDTFENYIDALNGASIAPSLNKIFGRSLGVSPADITFATYDDAGLLLTGGDSPHHGDYPGATRTWVFPNESKVVDSSGTVYSTSNLSFLNSFGTTIDDLQFLGADVSILLSGGSLTAFDNRLLPTGSNTPPTTPDNFYLHGADALLFSASSGAPNGIQVDTMPLSTLNPPTPGTPIDPVGLPYAPDGAFLDKDGLVYLFSKTHQSLFQWDPATQQYSGSIPLIGTPSHAAYSAVNHSCYLAYESGLIRSIDLNAAAPVEVPFTNLPGAPLGLATAGAYVFAVDPSGAWVSHYTFDAGGTMVEVVDWNYRSSEYIWSESNQKLYFFRDGTSPNDLLWEEINADGMTYPAEVPGGIGTKKDSPLHTSTGFTHPIRVAPDGSSVILGSGMIHDANSLERLPLSLANSVTDIAWLGSEIRTVRTISGVTQYQAWTGPTLAQGTVKQYPGEANRLFALDANRLLGIAKGEDGSPSFYVMDGSFNIIPPATLAKPTSLSISIPAANQIALSWADIAGENGYMIQRKVSSSSTWTQVGTTTTSVTQFTDISASPGNSYDYRVIARNGALHSAPSDPVLGVFGAPSAPASLTATALDDDRIRLTWPDVEFETGYKIERRNSPSGNWSQLTTVATDVTTYTNSGLSPNSSYDYRILATNAIGSSAWVNASATTDPVPPGTPSLYSPTATATTVNLSWSSGSYADEYVVQRMGGGAGWAEVAVVTATSYADTGLAPTTPYTYRVKARNGAGDSSWSTERTVTTLALPAPAIPGAFAARPESDTTILLTWQGVSEAAFYMIQRRLGQAGVWSDFALLSGDSSAFMDTGLTPGAEYCYRIASMNTVGNSAYSAVTCAVPANLFCLLETDFSDADFPNWLTLSAGEIIADGGIGFPPGEVAWFGQSGTRSAESQAVDVSDGGFLDFVARGGNENRDGSTYWEDPDSGEDLAVEYSLDGQAWTMIQTIPLQPANLGDWTPFFIQIPAAAKSSATQFRWRQLSNSGSGNDVWALDRLCIVAPIPAPPAAPTFVLAVSNTPDTAALYWAAVPDATSYQIDRITPGGAWTRVADLAAPQNYFTDSSLTPSSHYAYRLSSSGRGGQSPPTRNYYVTTLSLLDAWLDFHYPMPSSEERDEFLHTVNDRGLSVIDQFAYGLDPLAAPSTFDPATGNRGLPFLYYDAALQRLCAHFIRRRRDRNPEIEYRFETSLDGINWSPASAPATRTVLDPDWEEVYYEDATTSTDTPVKFGRVRVILP